MTSVYDIEHAFCEIYAVFTNIVPLGAQRGSGRAEATFLHRAPDRPCSPTRSAWIQPRCGARTWSSPSRCRSTTAWAGSMTPATIRRRWRKVLTKINYSGMPAAKAEARGPRQAAGRGSGPLRGRQRRRPLPAHGQGRHAGRHLGERQYQGASHRRSQRHRSAPSPTASRMRPPSPRSWPRSWASTSSRSRFCTPTPSGRPLARAATAAAPSASAARRRRGRPQDQGKGDRAGRPHVQGH